jgi:hypothetical protein
VEVSSVRIIVLAVFAERRTDVSSHSIASGYPFPVPWYYIPANIYINLRLALYTVSNSELRYVQNMMKENGVERPYTPLDAYTKDQVFISIGSLNTEYPLTTVPQNVIPCGPIYISSAPVSQQDPALAKWLKQAPTIFIMLGSHTDYDEIQARAMIQALRKVFDTTNHQVLWKFVKNTKMGDYSDDVFDVVREELQSGRLKLEKWIKADPAAILESGDVVLFVNHGGSNVYHEGVA